MNKENVTALNPLKDKKQKIDSLQALRAFAFLGIFCEHASLGVLGAGAWGVSVFIVLSGFLMTYSYYNRDIPCGISLKFAIKKLKRLYPLHIAIVLWLTKDTWFSVIKSFNIPAMASYIKALWPQLFIVQSWIMNHNVYFGINGVSWYLSLCLFLYAVFPLLIAYIRKIKSVKSAATIMILIYLLQFAFAYWTTTITVSPSLTENFSHWACYIFPVFRLGDFSIGCCMGYIFLHIRWCPTKIKATLMEIAAVLAFVICHGAYHRTTAGDWWKLTLLYVPVSVVLVWLFAHNKGLITWLSTNKLFIFLGNISPYTFLLHQFIIGRLQIYFYLQKGINLSVPQLAAVAFAVTLTLAVLWRWAEKIIGKTIQRIKNDRTVAGTV